MKLIRFKKQTKQTEKKRREKEFDSFIGRLKREGFEIDVINEKKIKKNCGSGIFTKIEMGFLKAKQEQIKQRRFRFWFEEKADTIQISESRVGWMVLNFAHPVEPDTLANLISNKEKELYDIESIMEELKTK